MMGGGSWSTQDWDNYSKTHIKSKATVDEIYSKKLKDNLNPNGVKFRESRDSEDNSRSTPIILALDVTGSMDKVLDSIAREGLNKMITEIYNRKPVTNPHICVMGIGDANCDDAPLQVTQFEADIRIAEQLKDIYFEKGGGGNNSESYHLSWYFAAFHTKIDSFEKRNEKGFLFTIGDERTPPVLTKEQIERVLGYKPEKNYSAGELFDIASKKYHIFHLIIKEGWHYTHYPDKVEEAWKRLLSQHAILVDDHTKLGEIIVSILQSYAGISTDEIIDSWNGDTSVVVKNAIKDLNNISNDNDLIEF